MPRLKSAMIPAATLLALLLLWDGAVRVFEFNRVVLPAPLEVAEAFLEKWDVLLLQTGVTMAEALLGFILGSVAAYLTAIGFVYSSILRAALYPYAVALKSTPLIAIAPLLIIWFGNGMLSKVVMAALVAFFPVLVTSVDGLGSINRETLDLMRSLSATGWQVLTKVRLQNSIPHLFSGLKVASSLAVVGAVIGEFTGATEGIGYLINVSSYYLETPLMFAGVIMIGLAGVAFFGAIVLLEPVVVFWTTRSNGRVS